MSSVLDDLSSCFQQAVLDPQYFQCITDSGVFSVENNVCKLQCTETAYPSGSCCDSAERLSNCQTSRVKLCKSRFDNYIADAYECGISSSQILLIIIAVLVFLMLVGIKILSRRAARLDFVRGSKADKLRMAVSKWISFLNNTRQLKVLIWKNYKIRSRHLVALLFEQLLPLMLSSVLVVLSNLDAFKGNGASSTDTRRLQNIQVCELDNSLDKINSGAPAQSLLDFYNNVTPVLGLFLLVCYIRFVATLSASMVREKETRIKEGMRMMGLLDGPLLLSWYFTYLVLYTPLAIAMTALLKFGRVFPMADFATLFFFFWAFGLAIVSFCYLMSPFFNKAKTASICAVIFWLFLFFMFYTINGSSSDTRINFALLLAPVCFGVGIDTLITQARRGTGFYYTASLARSPLSNLRSVGTCAWVLILDSLWMLMIAWYLDNVVPQQYGVRKKWNFCFEKSYWMSTKHKDGNISTSNIQTPNGYESSTQYVSNLEMAVEGPRQPSRRQSQTRNSAVESIDGELSNQEASGEGIHLFRLRREFNLESGKKVAVDNLNLSIYSGQITALLGHNGAGKTTTISMLTGLIEPTAGDAHIFGFSILRDMQIIRKSMGVCPQHDVLYDELTVKEHLQLYAEIKGVVAKDVDTEIMRKVRELGLTEKLNYFSKDLSGGQKRKLSVAIALLGESKVVFLDEPTAGMDPYSRRYTWNVLQKNRRNRVIVLTTHFMDEADLLGDRIAIVSQGKLCCAGSSLFLKARYGAGYQLTIVKDDNCDSQYVWNEILHHIPNATLLSDVGTELSVQLPMTDSPLFPNLLDMLDSRKRKLRILEYGMSVTTLEEVFLKIAREHDEIGINRAESLRRTWSQREYRPQPRMSRTQSQRNRLRISSTRQYWALLEKRIRYGKRDKKSLFFAVIVPLIFLLMLALLNEIEVSSYLSQYKTDAREYAVPYRECLDNLENNDIARRCALENERTPICNPYCHTSDVTCQSDSCGLNYRSKDDSRNQSWCSSDVGPLGDMVSTCETSWFSFCSLGLRDCDPKACCDFRNVDSPYFPCSSCEDNGYTCYNTKCMDKTGVRLQGTVNTFIVTLIIMLAFAFIPSATVIFVVKERESHQNAKHQQLVSGVGLFPYWASLYTFDLLVSVFPALAAFAFMPFYPGFGGDLDGILASAAILFMYLFAIVPLTYALSFLFSRHSTAQTMVLVFALVSGVLLGVVSYVCRLVEFDFGGPGSLTLAELDTMYLRWFYLIFPGYALQDGIFQIGMRRFGERFGTEEGYSSCSLEDSCWQNNVPGCCVPSPYDLNVAGYSMLYLALEAIFFAFFVLWIDGRVTRARARDDSPRITKADIEEEARNIKNEDVDVRTERLRVEHGQAKGDNIVLTNLRKAYPNGKVALQNLSLGIPHGTCFGYLGINGAGKTTTMKILTGYIAASSGQAYLGGRDISKNQHEVRKMMGYCPQFDALLDLLTVEEHLELFAKIKGVPSNMVKQVVNDKIQQLKLEIFRDKLSHTLSGGNKRKLSVAIALIGDPKIVFMDEPSTGQDPLARRFMWDVIAGVCRQDCTVVLTTHSMEECEALCSQIGILVNGRLQCLGSSQHLKARFGRGYSVEVRLQSPTTEEIEQLTRKLAPFGKSIARDGIDQACRLLGDQKKLSVVNACDSGWLVEQYSTEDGVPLDVFCSWWIMDNRKLTLQTFFQEKFIEAEVTENHGLNFSYNLPQQSLKLSDIFSLLEQYKNILHIIQYSVSQTTLEQIFNSFAADQDTNDIEFTDQSMETHTRSSMVRFGGNESSRRTDDTNSPMMENRQSYVL